MSLKRQPGEGNAGRGVADSTLLPTLAKLLQVEGASMLEEALTGSGAKFCHLPVGPGTRHVGLLETMPCGGLRWRA